MRWLVKTWLILVGGLAVAAEPQFPYKAIVNTENVYVRSGPGQNYYPTDRLKAGQEVEVYRHEPGGWCAIRPPEGSFSWVGSHYLEPQDANLAVVIAEGVAARIGSRFSDIREVIQVRLRRGEVVEVLKADIPGRRTPRGDDWVKIAPPAGEFRWISAKHIDPAGPAEQTSRPTARPDGKAAPRFTPEEFREELEAIDIELAIMVVEEPTVWSFTGLRERAQLLLEAAQSPVERGHARVLLAKLDRFAEIKKRHDALLAMSEEVGRQGRHFSELAEAADPKRAEKRRAENGGRFDGVGRLTEVLSAKPGAPRYVLVDEKGDVRCYVTPAPGVNLRHYVGQEIGVTGTRGYMPEQRAQHVMARHVSPLDPPRLQ